MKLPMKSYPIPQAECREFGEAVILATLRDKITKTLLVIGIEKFHFFKKFWTYNHSISHTY